MKLREHRVARLAAARQTKRATKVAKRGQHDGRLVQKGKAPQLREGDLYHQNNTKVNQFMADQADLFSVDRPVAT